MPVLESLFNKVEYSDVGFIVTAVATRRCFAKNVVLRTFASIIGEHLRWNLSLITLLAYSLKLFKKETLKRVFSCELSFSIVRWIVNHPKLKLNVTRHPLGRSLEQKIDPMILSIFC